jgi:signal transduction histidine kinase
VDQLIDLSRSRLGGGIPLARSHVRLAPLIESVIEDLARRYPNNRFSLSGNAELKGVWDPDRLRQVTASLIRNAVLHGLKDGPIDVVMSQDDAGTNFAVHNEVCDDEIAPEAELFDPYRDLGLYIVREIVEAHGGRVAVDSSSDGTTFRVLLPA